ncbi:MAG TPA: PQQ-dependent sugar dehydrogenase [Terriglobales bacterium]|nr:PQQ-dependent sugar dehydrogenase [Terriglobales bacterium]
MTPISVLPRIALLAFAVCCLINCGGGSNAGNTPTPTPSSPPQLALDLVASGFTSPLDLEQPDDGSGRLFVVEQGGKIKILQNGSILTTPFLDLSSKITTGGEMGLLGVTFHPDFATSRKLYVNYVRNLGGQIQSVIAEYSVSTSSPNQADVTSERILLTVNQIGNFSNHKAGQLAFGPDGFLYFGLGDGGSSGDPFAHGQSTQTLLGKLMRIDVDGTPSAGLQYRIPPDNPFVGGGGLPEIYAYGFRNPWRFSFDRTGRLFLADVGESQFEEVDLVQRGGNYGWNIMEASHCFSPATGCNMTGLILPIAEYSHQEGNAIIGGYLYRGNAIASLQGTYVFGDLGSGKIWGLQQQSGANTWTRTLLATTGKTISSFGQDQAGELYLVDLSGSIFRVRAQ